MKKRLASLLSLSFILLFTAVLVSGCKNDSSNDNISSYAKIIVVHEDWPDDVGFFSFAAYNTAGECIWGPSDVVAQDRVSMYAVPIVANSYSITYYDTDGVNPLYFYSSPIELEAGEVITIENPDFESVDNFNFVDFACSSDARAHVGDLVSFDCTAIINGSDGYYFQNLTEYCKWATDDTTHVATTDADSNKLGKGTYRCVSVTPADKPVNVTATFGKYASDCDLEITDATITKAELTLDYEGYVGEETETKAEAKAEAITSTSVPTGAELFPVFFVATWSDGQYSLLNSSAVWVTSNKLVCEVNDGCLVGFIADEENANKATIQATYSSNGNTLEADLNVTVIDADITSIMVADETIGVDVGDIYSPVVYATYANSTSEVTCTLPEVFGYTLSSSDKSVASVEDGDVIANKVGEAIITVTSTAKSSVKTTFKVCVVEASDDSPEEPAEDTEDSTEE